jgi:Flp pilus assembly protein TadB
MIIALLCGAGVGLGGLLLYRGARPPQPVLSAALERMRPGYVDPASATVLGGRLEVEGARLGKRIAMAMDSSGLRLATASADLAVIEKPVERFYLDKVLFAVVGLLLVPALVAGLGFAGLKLAVIVPVWVSLLLGVGGFFLPDVLIKHEASERRRSFRHALSAFLELVRINLAGGAGIEGALHDAVTVGQGWAFARLRETPWAALGRLGADLRIDELIELSSSLVLAGNEGAKIRESLGAKADSLRRHEAAVAEGKAAQASERMSLPVGFLLLGFLIFLGYPAIGKVLSGI